MHIPMEILSPTTTRADSGTGTLVSRLSFEKTNAGFEKAFEKELSKHESKLRGRNESPVRNTEKPTSVGRAKQETIKRKDMIDGDGQELAAGVMGEQQKEVVFILEGEESVATPQMRVDDINPPEVVQEVIQEQTAETQADNANTDSVQGEVHAEKPDKAEFKDMINAKTGTATETIQDNVAGEVTARKPEDNESGSSLKDDGNPSLLENENENSQVEGQESKTYSRAYEAIANKAENGKNGKTDEVGKTDETAKVDTAPTPTSNMALPLSDGIKTEQFQATQQMTQAAADSAVKPENLFEEMISRVESMQNNTTSTMIIQLNPEFLGKVALEVALDATGLHVKIKAEDNSVRNAINTGLTTLIESLESKGIAVSEVEVVYAGANFDNLSGQSNGQQETGSHGHTSRQHVEVKSSIEYYTTITDLMDYYLDTGISSVEYRA